MHRKLLQDSFLAMIYILYGTRWERLDHFSLLLHVHSNFPRVIKTLKDELQFKSQINPFWMGGFLGGYSKSVVKINFFAMQSVNLFFW